VSVFLFNIVLEILAREITQEEEKKEEEKKGRH
jgi:hypothetical protein